MDATLLAAATEASFRGPWGALLGLVAIALGGGGITALLRSRGERSVLGADAAKVITEAAATLLQPLQSEVSRLTERVAVLERDQHNQRLLLVEHAVWDHLALQKLADAGIDLPSIPPLFAAAATQTQADPLAS